LINLASAWHILIKHIDILWLALRFCAVEDEIYCLGCCCFCPGANVVLTTKGIDDMCCKYFVEAGVLAVRRVPKDDLK
jgi:hypothetical protein